MRAASYRMNRTSYGIALVALIVAYIVLVNTVKRPPGAEAIVAFIAVPRLHDIGRSGWWLLPLFGGEFLAVAIGWSGGVEGILLAGGMYVLFCLVLLTVLAFIPGQSTANNWGEPPGPGVRFGRSAPAKAE
jgi:uncharacterized membrane protein YhaH (DUF805 family)